MLATYTVNVDYDVVSWTDTDSEVSLREAVERADQDVVNDTINFAPSLEGETITLGIDENGTPINFPVGAGALQVTEPVEITGPGWDLLTIDATAMQGSGDIGDGERVLNINAGANENVTIRDLSITGGDADNGGGLRANLLFSATLTLERLRVHGNTADRGGGGISIDAIDSTVTIDDVILEDNHVYTDDTIDSNPDSNFVAGGGMSIVSDRDVELTRMLVQNNTIDTPYQSNTTGGRGGGLYLNVIEDANLRLTESRITGNVVGQLPQFEVDEDFDPPGYSGGGIFVTDIGSSIDYANVTIDHVAIDGNTAIDQGGGIFWLSGLLGGETPSGVHQVVNSVIAENHARDGGGVHAIRDLDIKHSTIARNTAGWQEQQPYGDLLFGRGGGIFTRSYSNGTDSQKAHVSLDHTIVADNVLFTNGKQNYDYTQPTEFFTTQSHGTDIAIRQSGGGPSDDAFEMDIQYSLVESVGDILEVASTGIGATLSLPSPPHLLTGDPKLASELMPNSAVQFINGERMLTLALLPTSQAIDAGDPSFTPTNVPTYPMIGALESDQRTSPFQRVYDTPGVGVVTENEEHFIDIGAYEVNPPKIFSVGIGSHNRSDDQRFQFEHAGGLYTDQSVPVPVGFADRYYISFSEDVSGSVVLEDFVLLNMGQGQISNRIVEPIALTQIDTNTYRWEFVDEATATSSTRNPDLHESNRYALVVSDRIEDAHGVALDGEWNNAETPTSPSSQADDFRDGSVSGDGTAGGSFALLFALLYGDATGDGAVTGADLNAVSTAFGNVTDDPSFYLFGDANFDGAVTGADQNLVSIMFGNALGDYGVFGDVTGDGIVDSNDITFLNDPNNYIGGGATLADGDLDGDNDVDGDDLNLLTSYHQALDAFYSTLGISSLQIRMV